MVAALVAGACYLITTGNWFGYMILGVACGLALS